MQAMAENHFTGPRGLSLCKFGYLFIETGFEGESQTYSQQVFLALFLAKRAEWFETKCPKRTCQDGWGWNHQKPEEESVNKQTLANYSASQTMYIAILDLGGLMLAHWLGLQADM